MGKATIKFGGTKSISTTTSQVNQPRIVNVNICFTKACYDEAIGVERDGPRDHEERVTASSEHEKHESVVVHQQRKEQEGGWHTVRTPVAATSI